MIVGLRQQNLDVLEDMFWAVSDHNSPSYGQHLSLEELRELTAPDLSVYQRVSGWLLRSGAATDIRLMPSGDFMKATVSLSMLPFLTGSKHSGQKGRGSRRSNVASSLSSLCTCSG